MIREVIFLPLEREAALFRSTKVVQSNGVDAILSELLVGLGAVDVGFFAFLVWIHNFYGATIRAF